jgi:transposase
MAARSARQWLKIKWHTINLTCKHFRELIVQQSFEENSRNFGVFDLEERSRKEKRVRGKRGRGAAGKTPVFSLLNVLRKLKKRMEVREELVSAL